ncbi:carboxypeptidase-like regulatory domain-containing protein [Psychroserpens sp. S379A]|uniref:carboxypeptidase-like regulatory domain-containing protein n=1 Tax=Psychroserpens sp. S379A TaxID=3415137 RepID=UPI003C7BC50E
MRTSIQIDIPKPCHEDWTKMTPKEKGRHCASCKKTVYDFTNKTDESIVKTFISDGKVCGRFKVSQLNRELVLNRKKKNNYLSFIASTLFTFLSIGNQDIKAQETPVLTKIDKALQGNLNFGSITKTDKEKLIYGNVTSALDRLPLPGVNIIIKGTSKGVQSDFDGNFSIKVKTGDVLVFSFLGMNEKEIIISNQNTISISLEEDINECLKVVVIGYPSVNYYNKCEAKKRKNQRKLHREQIRNGNIERTNVGKFLYRITNIFRKTKE